MNIDRYLSFFGGFVRLRYGYLWLWLFVRHRNHKFTYKLTKRCAYIFDGRLLFFGSFAADAAAAVWLCPQKIITGNTHRKILQNMDNVVSVSRFNFLVHRWDFQPDLHATNYLFVVSQGSIINYIVSMNEDCHHIVSKTDSL